MSMGCLQAADAGGAVDLTTSPKQLQMPAVRAQDWSAPIARLPLGAQWISLRQALGLAPMPQAPPPTRARAVCPCSPHCSSRA